MKERSHSIDIIVALLLFCLFTGAMLAVLLSGAGAYKDVNAEMEEQFGERTCVSYIAAKVRHYDSLDSVEITDFGGVDALSMKEEIEGATYITLLYYYEGYVKELFFEEGINLAPEDGLNVIAAEGLALEEAEPGLLRVECLAGGRSAELYLALRTGEAGERP